MDFFNVVHCQNKSGVPLGGIGCGTIGRGFRGDFCGYQMKPGIYEYYTSHATQFIVNIQDENGKTLYQKVLSCSSKPDGYVLNQWDWSFPPSDAEYTALYPQSWTVFDIKEQNIKLICRQVSPVIPHNYKDSSLPVAVFEWRVINNNKSHRFVSITFTFKNGTGSPSDKTEPAWSESFDKKDELGAASGVTIRQSFGDLPCSYSVASSINTNTAVTRSLYFKANGNGSTIWNALKKNGDLKSEPDQKTLSIDTGTELGCAVCSRINVSGYSEGTLSFSLSWDMPKIHFPGGNIWKTRYYTKYFGDIGHAGPEICFHSLKNYKQWIAQINSWQEDILNNKTTPDWFKSALLNELYYVSNGGTVWLLLDDEEKKKLSANDPRLEFGRFGYLEGHEYIMYNTYDVHFYASFALAMLWPKLQLALQYDFNDAIAIEDKTQVWFLYNGICGQRKVKDTVPHDLGSAGNQAFSIINYYPIHDVSKWKDLNLKFVLQVYRDYTLMKDKSYLVDMFPNVIRVMEYSLQWDTDNDGLIENSGFPDQTYDTWIMRGTSSYCGSLWLAALVVLVEMAKILGDKDVEEKFNKILLKGKVSFDKKLFNGSYYIYDSSNGEHSKSIMADQLCGLWYLHCCGLKNNIFVETHVKSSLKVVFENNVSNYYNGEQGAVNGMLPDGSVDTSSTQSGEVWTGVSYALACLLIQEGFYEEGFKTASGIYNTVYNKSGLGFSTPEALFKETCYRSVGYMRPLSIWSIQLALQKVI
ncbi:non-lysosomal glucosylceramidase isoform X2 [Cimex lectularius]|nr:non-lysosomal glucosylceramidase isoform X2 [Cimex lectularius]